MTVPDTGTRAHQCARIAGFLLMAIGSLRVFVDLAFPFLVRHSSSLDNVTRWQLYSRQIELGLQLAGSGLTRLWIGLFVAWALHVLIGAYAVLKRPWARAAAVVLSGFYSVGIAFLLISRPIVHGFDTQFFAELLVLIVYLLVIYLLMREDVARVYERSDHQDLATHP